MCLPEQFEQLGSKLLAPATHLLRKTRGCTLYMTVEDEPPFQHCPTRCGAVDILPVRCICVEGAQLDDQVGITRGIITTPSRSVGEDRQSKQTHF